MTVLALLLASFFLIEPTVGRGQASDTDEFLVTQVITGESSFLIPTPDVSMVGPIAGVTGGQATGTTDFVITSNNSNGYTVEIAFNDNGTEEAMRGNSSLSSAIRDYGGDVTGEPSYGYTASSAAQFAYTVTSDTPGDTDQSFFHDVGETACNELGGVQTGAPCWKSPTTTGFRIVDTNNAAVTGATSTITFSVVVPGSAVPTPVADTYTATVTLSVFDK